MRNALISAKEAPLRFVLTRLLTSVSSLSRRVFTRQTCKAQSCSKVGICRLWVSLRRPLPSSLMIQSKAFRLHDMQEYPSMALFKNLTGSLHPNKLTCFSFPFLALNARRSSFFSRIETWVGPETSEAVSSGLVEARELEFSIYFQMK